MEYFWYRKNAVTTFKKNIHKKVNKTSNMNKQLFLINSQKYVKDLLTIKN